MQRKRQFAEAEAHVRSETCTNATLNQMLGSYGASCREARQIVQVMPFLRSLYDVLEDVHLCGHQRCELAYIEFSQNLPYLTVAFVALVYLVVRLRGRARQEHLQQLPLKLKDL